MAPGLEMVDDHRVVREVGILIWVALMRRGLLGGYRYPKVLAYVGLAVWLLTIYLGYESFSGILDLWEQ